MPSMCHNFRNENRLQWLQRKQHEIVEFEGDKMVGASGFVPNRSVKKSKALRVSQLQAPTFQKSCLSWSTNGPQSTDWPNGMSEERSRSLARELWFTDPAAGRIPP
jgi:hypothetical protein